LEAFHGAGLCPLYVENLRVWNEVEVQLFEVCFLLELLRKDPFLDILLLHWARGDGVFRVQIHLADSVFVIYVSHFRSIATL